MALRASAPIYVTQQVLDQAKVAFASQGQVPAAQSPSAEGQGASQEEGDEGQEEEASQDFRAVDKDKWEEILQDLDPDDFKYKM